jgi:hypothetical protein
MLNLMRLSEILRFNSEMEKVVNETLKGINVAEEVLYDGRCYILFDKDTQEEVAQVYFDEIAEETTVKLA